MRFQEALHHAIRRRVEMLKDCLLACDLSSLFNEALALLAIETVGFAPFRASECKLAPRAEVRDDQLRDAFLLLWFLAGRHAGEV